jgi:hypothetical protein
MGRKNWNSDGLGKTDTKRKVTFSLKTITKLLF